MSLETKTKESPTVDGPIEYEAVECRYCENDVPVNDAVVAYTPYKADKKRRIGGNHCLKVEYASDGGQTAFCPTCYESIFGQPPSPNYLRRLEEHSHEREWVFACTLAAHLLLLALAAAGVISILGVVLG